MCICKIKTKNTVILILKGVNIDNKAVEFWQEAYMAGVEIKQHRYNRLLSLNETWQIICLKCA